MGDLFTSETESLPFRWTEDTGLVALPAMSEECHATAVSDDGTVIAGWCRLPGTPAGGVALRWRGATVERLDGLAHASDQVTDQVTAFSDVQLGSGDATTYAGVGVARGPATFHPQVLRLAP